MGGSGHKLSENAQDRIRWFVEPLERLRNEAAARFGAPFANLSPLRLLEILERKGVVDASVAGKYRAAYQRIRFTAGTEIDKSACAEVREALIRALPPVESLQELNPELCDARDAATAASDRLSSSVRPQAGVRPGWTRPPVVWDSLATSEEDRAGSSTEEKQAASGGRSTRRGVVLALGFLLLLAWTGGTAAATYALRHRITAALWKLRYGRDYPGSRHSAGNRRSRLEQMMDDFAHAEMSEEERGQLAAEIARLAYAQDLFLLAEHFYHAALERRPTDAELLNELAWMLLTRGESWFQDVLQGYRLARRAVQLAPRPHIKDTLAEAYYLMGRYREAVELEEEVLTEAREGRDFYQRQLQKFRRALDEQQRKATRGTPSQRNSNRTAR